MSKNIFSFCLFTLISFNGLTCVEVSLDDAIQKGFYHSYGLQKAAIEVNIADANSYQAYLLPNPQFSLNGETSSFMHDHDDNPSIAYGIGQIIETRQKRRSRREIAAAQQAVSETNFAQVKLEVILAIKQAYINAAIAKELAKLALENKLLQERIVETSKEKAALGKLSFVEKIKAESCCKLSTIEHRKKNNAYEKAKMELGYFIGYDPEEFEICFDVFQNVELPDLNFCENENNLIKIKNWEIEAAEQQVALEEAKKTPDVAINLGLFHEDKTQPSGLFFGISFALPIFDNNDASVSKAYLAVEKHEIEKREFIQKLHIELKMKRLNLEQAYEEILCYQECLLAKAEEEYLNLTECYEANKIGIEEIFKAKQTCLEYQEKYLDVLSRYYTLLNEFQKLVGCPQEI